MRNNYTVSENKYRANNIAPVCISRVFRFELQIKGKTIATGKIISWFLISWILQVPNCVFGYVLFTWITHASCSVIFFLKFKKDFNHRVISANNNIILFTFLDIFLFLNQFKNIHCSWKRIDLDETILSPRFYTRSFIQRHSLCWDASIFITKCLFLR